MLRIWIRLRTVLCFYDLFLKNVHRFKRHNHVIFSHVNPPIDKREHAFYNQYTTISNLITVDRYHKEKSFTRLLKSLNL